jgi:2-aminoadipate transaminase
METLWSRRFSLASERTRSSAIRELLKLTQNPEVISFAGGLPATEAFPVAEFREAAERILSAHAAQALQYGSTEGYLPLREMIARHTGRWPSSSSTCSIRQASIDIATSPPPTRSFAFLEVLVS